MSETQIKNVIALCKGNPLGNIIRLVSMYRSSDIEAMAKYFGCENTREAVTMKLANGGR